LVIEASLNSGSLITARSALQCNRDIYAVPGSIHAPMSQGPLSLIKEGATPVTTVADILGHEAVEPPASPNQYTPSSQEEVLILKQLTHEPRHIDEIVRDLSLPTSTVLSTMSLMEMKGGVRQERGQFYSRIA
jgi:DNA processing protein